MSGELIELPGISIELKRAENLKPEVRKKYNLPDTGLVVKKIVRNSPAEFYYTPAKNGFLQHIREEESKVDMSQIVTEMKAKIESIES